MAKTAKSSARSSFKKSLPWERGNPRKKTHTKLTQASKATAKATAKRHGRGYPNLVDNMNTAKKQKARKIPS